MVSFVCNNGSVEIDVFPGLRGPQGLGLVITLARKLHVHQLQDTTLLNVCEWNPTPIFFTTNRI